MNIAILGLVFLVFLLWYRANALEKKNKTLELAIEALNGHYDNMAKKHNDLCQAFTEYSEAQVKGQEHIRASLIVASELMQMIAIEQDNTNNRTETIEEVLGIKGK